jgi:hypothetical protein
MKTIKFFIVACLSTVLFSNTIFANGSASAEEKGAKAEELIRSQILYTFSDVNVEDNLVVYVLFSVDKEKGFAVKEVSSFDQSFATMVKTKLSKSNISAPASLEGDYLIKIRFVPSENALASGKSYTSVNGTDVLRSIIADNMNSINTLEKGSVNVKFNVKDNSVSVKAIDGENNKLVKTVDEALKSAKLNAPEGIAGNYQIKVTF